MHDRMNGTSKDKGLALHHRGPGRVWVHALLVAAAAMLAGFALSGCDSCTDRPLEMQKAASEPPGLPEPASPPPSEPERATAPPPRPSESPSAPSRPSESPAAAGAPTRPAQPEQAPASPEQAPASPDADSVTEAEIGLFADAQIELALFQQEFAKKAQAEGISQQQLQQQFQQEATKIIQDSELSPDRFNEISSLVQRDVDLQNRVRSLLQEKMKQQQPPPQ